MTAVREWEARNAQSLREQEARARLEQEQEQLSGSIPQEPRPFPAERTS